MAHIRDGRENLYDVEKCGGGMRRGNAALRAVRFDLSQRVSGSVGILDWQPETVLLFVRLFFADF